MFFQINISSIWGQMIAEMLSCLTPLSSTFSMREMRIPWLKVVDSGGADGGGATSPYWTGTAAWEQWPILLAGLFLSWLHLFLLSGMCICNDSIAEPVWNAEDVCEWNSSTSCFGRETEWDWVQMHAVFTDSNFQERKQCRKSCQSQQSLPC